MAGTEILWDADDDTSAGIISPQTNAAAPSRKMTFLSTLGQSANTSDDGRAELRGSAALVLVSLALLWVFGGVVFKDARL